ncbi:unnamed protein product [Closterium sp. NIES-65]|nr:unnamed protein product [Closterium sp. NIES-65]
MEAPVSLSAAVSTPAAAAVSTPADSAAAAAAAATAAAAGRIAGSTHNATPAVVAAFEATRAQGTRPTQPVVHPARPLLMAQAMPSGTQRRELGVERRPIHRRSATEKRRRHRVSAGIKQLEKAIPASWLRQQCSTNLAARTDTASLLHAAVAFIKQLEVRRSLCFRSAIKFDTCGV